MESKRHVKTDGRNRGLRVLLEGLRLVGRLRGLVVLIRYSQVTKVEKHQKHVVRKESDTS